MKLFPIEILEHSIEPLIHKFSKKSYIIYRIVLIALMVAFVSLFFINIDISVRAAGMLKPPGERIVIYAPSAGFLIALNVSENKHVMQGDTLFTIKNETLKEQLTLHQKRQKEVATLLSDLSVLIKINKDNKTPHLQLNSNVYAQSYAVYLSQLRDSENKLDLVVKDYNRDKKLFEQKVIALADYEVKQTNLLNAQLVVELVFDQQLNKWKTDEYNYATEMSELNTKIKQATIQIKELTVTAPVDGTIQQLGGFRAGSHIGAGIKLAEISPHQDLIIECYVQPKDIGYIKRNQKVSMQVDALNYNDWGMLAGEVVDIAHDIATSTDGKAYFKIYCSMETQFLELKNGHKGHLIKGMGVNARFLVNRRTLFQLLYDKADDWMNPNTNQ